jgi:superfamily II DNA or RNA helicase
MSIRVKTTDLSEKDINRINCELPIEIIANKYAKNAPSTWVYPYEHTDKHITLPFAFAIKSLSIPRRGRAEFTPMLEPFNGQLYPEQVEVRDEAINWLSRKGSVIVSAYAGFGKTLTAINMACKIRFQTLVVVHNLTLMKQWEDSIILFCPNARIRRVTSKSVYKEADFYIINAQNAEKKGKTFFSNIGLVIVDEVHKILAASLSRCLQYVHPRYLLGLSATPYRPDGLNKLFELYFGTHPKVVRDLYRKHIAYRVNTGFKPKIEKTVTGQLNWNTILESQANDKPRNDLIIKIVTSYPDRTFMILTKRLSQGAYLAYNLHKQGVTISSMMGTNQICDKSARVVIGTVGKIGTGFDHQGLNALILAADVQEYFTQFLGRVFRTRLVEPIVFDLVDKQGVLEKHYSTRKALYLKHGGTVKTFDNLELNQDLDNTDTKLVGV